jgi:tRNA pseudouridine55 synthase
MGRRRRRESDLHGVLLVDKPAGPTSHDVVQQVRRAAGQDRIGHTGTLDPAATGVLVLCLGRAAKLVRFLQAGTKTYAARMVLGVATDSQDADGEVVATADASQVTERSLCEALTRFQGEILQVPPMVSAVRIEGERLHEKARRGETVTREPRSVTVHDLVLDAFEPGPRAEASFLVTCSAGTYVRTIAHDVGETLGVGGSLLSLRRIANGPFAEHEAVALDALTDEAVVRDHLLRAEDAVLRALPATTIDDPDLARRLTQGGRLPSQGFDGPYALTYGSRLIGIYTDGDQEARSALVWTRPEELVLEDPA